MRRIDTATAAADLFGPGKNGFRDGDPLSAILATRLNAAFFNSLQEEMAGVIEAAGITLDPNANDQLIKAIRKLDGLNTTRVGVASAANVNLTTAAPYGAHLNITGTTTIAGFTVAAGRSFFVRFNGILTLTNSASLVTQLGADIVTAAGDTCIIRATAANVVEILAYTRSKPSSFSAWHSASQSLAMATPTLIKFQTELFDTENCYDPSTGLYTVPADDVYEFSASVHMNSAGTTALASNIDLYVGGVQTRRMQEQNGLVNALVGTSGRIYLTKGQTVGVYAHVGGTTANTNAFAALTWFSGGRVS